MHACFRLPRLRAFAKADLGAVTIFAVIAFSMLVVVVGLVIDIGRVMNVHSQANSYADRVALAAAAELDGQPAFGATPGALVRAVNAAQGANRQVDPGYRLSLSGDTTIGVRKLTFLSALGPDPADPYTPSPVAGDVVTATWTPGGGFQPASAATDPVINRNTAFVLVDTTRETENFLFFSLLGALNPGLTKNTATVAPQAVAGFKEQICNTTPLMVCNPAEGTLGAGAAFTPTPGQIIRARLQSGTNSGSWNSNNFTLLDVPSTSTTALRDYMAKVDPATSCHGDQIVAERNIGGSTQRRNAIRDGLNVRFDMYPSNTLYNLRNDTQYAPARNVTKGLHTDVVGNGGNRRCSTGQSNTTIPFPRQSNWSRSTYWNQNFNGSPPSTLHTGVSYLSATRYQIYREEIEWSPPGRVNQNPNGNGEQGAPYCSNQNGTTDATRDRRVLQVAVVNCVANRNRLASGQQVKVEAYAEMFMSEPMANTAWPGSFNDELNLEVVGYLRPNLPQIAQRAFPVLYR